MKYVFPVITMIQAVGAGGIYLAYGDWRRAGYWFCAAAITFFVTA